MGGFFYVRFMHFVALFTSSFTQCSLPWHTFVELRFAYL